MMQTEDKAILSTVISLFESFETQGMKSLEYDPEARILITGLKDFFFNNIFLKKPKDQDKLIEELKSFHQNLAKPLMVWVTAETESPELEAKMKAHFDSHGSFYGMLLDVGKAHLIDCPEQISIEALETEEAATNYANIFCNLFQLNNTHDAMKSWLMKQYQNDNPSSINYIAKMNGELAGICTLSLNYQFSEFKVGGFYNTCVLPKYRKSGVATAMASHRVKKAKALVLEYLSVILMSDAMARGYCEKLGFKNYKTLTPFFLP